MTSCTENDTNGRKDNTMKKIGRFLASDNLGYMEQISATREEVVNAFESALTNRRLGAGDIGQPLADFSPEQWETVRGWMKTTRLVLAGMFYDGAVPHWPPGAQADYHFNAKGPCRCPVSVITEGAGGVGPNDGLPWDFICAWDAQWLAFPTNGRRAVIYVEE